MSNETKHTNGPWKAVVARDGAKIITTSPFEPTGRSVAWVGADDTKERGGRIVEVMSDEAKANAALIAAAPDLLDALLRFANLGIHPDDNPEALYAARDAAFAAITKARGSK